MSTRSYIGIVNEDKSVDYIYTHFDGYPDCNGRILVKYYTTEKEVRELIDLGDFSSLERTIVETKENIYNEPKSKASHYKLWLNRKHSDISFIYLWKDNKWSCFRNSGNYTTNEITLYY